MPRKKAPAAVSAATLAEEETLGIEAYELPKSIVARLAKASVPPEVKLQKELPLALVKGSTVFINYLAALSHDAATERSHKTITAGHVLEAVKQLGWEDGSELVKQLKSELIAFREVNEEKKAKAKAAPPGRAFGAPATTSGGKGKEPVRKEVTMDGVPAGLALGGQQEARMLVDDRQGADEDEAYGEGEEEEEEEYEEEEEEEEEVDGAEEKDDVGLGEDQEMGAGSDED